MAIKSDKNKKKLVGPDRTIKSNYKPELAKSKYVKTINNVPAFGSVKATNTLASRQNLGLVDNQEAVGESGDIALQGSIESADKENEYRRGHNRSVRTKILNKRLADSYEQGKRNLAAAKGKFGYTFNPGTGQFEPTAGFTGGGSGGSLGGLGLSTSQQNNAKKIIEVGRKRGLSQGDITIGLMTSLAETRLRNLKGGDRDSGGLFQQRPSQGWGTRAQVTNADYASNKFYDALGKSKRGANPWNTAQNVQRSAFASGSNYKAQYGLATKIMAAYNNPAATSIKANTPVTKWMNAQVGKYHDYDKAYGTQCVDLFRYYLQFKGQPQPGGVGGAKNIWASPKIAGQMAKSNTRVSKNARSRTGDIAVFGGALGSGYGHVGIVVADNGSTIKLLNSNSSTVGNGKATNIVTISKRGLSGYWRPKR